MAKVDLEKLKARIKGEERVTLRQEPLPLIESKIVEVTAGEIRAICEAHPDHPLAADKLKSVDFLSDDQIVGVDAVDMEALLDNRTIKTVTEERDGGVVYRKELGDTVTHEDPPPPPHALAGVDRPAEKRATSRPVPDPANRATARREATPKEESEQ